MVYFSKYIIIRIYEFDPTYHLEYKKVLNVLKNLPRFISYNSQGYFYRYHENMGTHNLLKPSTYYFAFTRKNSSCILKNKLNTFFYE